MKKLFSILSAAVFSLVCAAANTGNISASVYNDVSKDNVGYCCILRFADDPLSKYEYAREHGVNEFIFTDEGQEAYEELMEYHEGVIMLMNTFFGHSIPKLYDYTAAYNGMAVVLSRDEYREVCEEKESMGIDAVYNAEPYYISETVRTYSGGSGGLTYVDMTDRILEQTGISNVSGSGESIAIAVIDSGFDYEHEFLSTMPDGVRGRIDSGFIENISPYLSASGENESDCYFNEKIPFIHNYYKGTEDKEGDNKLLHGTHVAGIAGGNGAAETDPVYDPKGAAPGAQLLLMGTNLKKASIMAAYDDSVYLGADIINASFGTDYMPVSAEPFSGEMISNLNAAGIMFCTSSGNASKAVFAEGDSLLNTDYASGGTPNGIASAFTVGSADNIISENRVITAGGENYVVLSAGNSDISEVFAGETMGMVFIPGYGTEEDFEGINVEGKIVVIQRGIIPFDEKAYNARVRGAKGVIFYNNEDDPKIEIVCYLLPSCIISRVDGQRLVASGDSEVTFDPDIKLISNMDNKMSSFSAWGFTENLVLKPDITAYGGNIISSVPGGKYEFDAGTSMASPQIAGMTALLKEHLKQNKEKYGIENESDYPELMARLLMSTAEPIYNSVGSELASPRVQGSGLANVENAVNTPVYLYTDSEEDNFRPKLSLGDGLEANASDILFSNEKFNFHIKNISDKAKTYILSAELLRDNAEGGNLSADVVSMPESTVEFKSGFSSIGKITVQPGEDVVISAQINFSPDDENYIRAKFPNGTFIDGFIRLKCNSAPSLCLPFTGYYGSWNKCEIFENFAYTDLSPYSSVMGDGNGNLAGVNVIKKAFDNELSTTIPSYSPNGDNILDDISLLLSFKRRCKNISVKIYKGSKCVHTENFPFSVGFVNINTGFIEYKVNYPLDDAKEGELYSVWVTAEKPFSENGSDKEVISQQFSIDLAAPTAEECRELDINGEKYMLIKISDNSGIQGAVMNDDFDYNCCENNSTKHYSLLKMPEDPAEAHAVVYDIAGNSTELTSKDMKDEKYILSYDENLYFSNKDSSFKKKIIMKGSNGNNVNYNIVCTPEKAYQDGITQVPVCIGSTEIISVPVSVGMAGDADMNDAVNLYDAIRISKYVLWKKNPGGTFKNDFIGYEGSLGEYLADFNGNGKVDIYDAIGIAKSVLSSSNKK